MKKIILLIILCWQSTLFASGLKCENLFDSDLYKVRSLMGSETRSINFKIDQFIQEFSAFLDSNEDILFFSSQPEEVKDIGKKILVMFMKEIIAYMNQNGEADLSLKLISRFSQLNPKTQKLVFKSLYVEVPYIDPQTGKIEIIRPFNPPELVVVHFKEIPELK